MDSLIHKEIIFTIAMVVFFISSEYLIDSSPTNSLYDFAVSAQFILWIVALPMIIGKFILLKKRLSEMSERRMPIHTPYYKPKVILTASQSVVSMFTISVSSFALAMSLFVAFGVNSEPFLQALHNEHVATYALFPICDLVFLWSISRKKK